MRCSAKDCWHLWFGKPARLWELLGWIAGTLGNDACWAEDQVHVRKSKAADAETCRPNKAEHGRLWDEGHDAYGLCASSANRMRRLDWWETVCFCNPQWDHLGVRGCIFTRCRQEKPAGDWFRDCISQWSGEGGVCGLQQLFGCCCCCCYLLSDISRYKKTGKVDNIYIYKYSIYKYSTHIR